MADEGTDSASLNRFAMGFGATVVGMAVALWAYFQFVAPDVARDAEEVAASRDAPVRTALAGGGEAAARDALNWAAGYRTAVSEVYINNGAWPASMAATGVAPPDPATSGAVQTIDIGPGGVITVHLRAPFASGSRFVLTPTAGSDYSIQWACRSEGDPALHAAVPEC